MGLIPFGATQEFGARAGWNDQSPDRSTNKDRKFSLSKAGEETASVVHSPKIEVNAPYDAATDGTVDIPGTLGALVNSLVLTSIDVKTNTDEFAKLTLQGHNHGENPHSAGDCKEGTHGIGPILGFGATDFLGGTAGTDADLKSGGITIKCEHVDENAGTAGTHAPGGENFHGIIEAETEWLGSPETATDGSWDEVTSTTKTDNKGLKRTTVKGTKKLVLA